MIYLCFVQLQVGRNHSANPVHHPLYFFVILLPFSLKSVSLGAPWLEGIQPSLEIHLHICKSHTWRLSQCFTRFLGGHTQSMGENFWDNSNIIIGITLVAFNCFQHKMSCFYFLKNMPSFFLIEFIRPFNHIFPIKGFKSLDIPRYTFLVHKDLFKDIYAYPKATKSFREVVINLLPFGFYTKRIHGCIFPFFMWNASIVIYIYHVLS